MVYFVFFSAFLWIYLLTLTSIYCYFQTCVYDFLLVYKKLIQIEFYKRVTGTNFLRGVCWGGNFRAMTERLKSQFPRSDIQCQIPNTPLGESCAWVIPRIVLINLPFLACFLKHQASSLPFHFCKTKASPNWQLHCCVGPLRGPLSCPLPTRMLTESFIKQQCCPFRA